LALLQLQSGNGPVSYGVIMVDAAMCISGSVFQRIKQAKQDTHGPKQFMKALPAIICGNGMLLIRLRAKA